MHSQTADIRNQSFSYMYLRCIGSSGRVSCWNLRHFGVETDQSISQKSPGRNWNCTRVTSLWSHNTIARKLIPRVPPIPSMNRNEALGATWPDSQGAIFFSHYYSNTNTVMMLYGWFSPHTSSRKWKNKILNHSIDKFKKLICCRRVIHKQRVQATGLCDIS